MSFMDKFKNFMGLPDDEYFDDDDDKEYEEFEEEPQQNDFDPPREKEKIDRNNNKVVNIHATSQLQVVLAKPEQFEDAGGIADHLNSKRTVVLNLESANRDVSRRLIDFLSGVAYANGGQIKKVSNATYIITPYNVGIMGDSILDELENNGVYF